MSIMIRAGEPRDEDDLFRMRQALWRDEEANESRVAVRELLLGEWPGLLPATVLIAEIDGEAAGFVEVSLRSLVDGCAPHHPVGYLEGWYVDPKVRGRGVGRSLSDAAAAWCRDQGCREMGSDTWLDNEAAQRAHAALGYEVVDHCVNYRKSLGPPVDAEGEHYGPDLGALHHHHSGHVARDAAAELRRCLSTAGFDHGLVVDLAAGSGILSRAMVDAGFTAYGVDISAAMLDLARSTAPEATFVQGSLWQADLPEDAVAVAAVGEAFSYAADPAAGLESLRDRLISIHRALTPGGVLIFDVAGPGRSGPTGIRERVFHCDGAYIHLDEREDRAKGTLTRDLSLILPLGRLYRRVDERHRLRLFDPGSVGELLTDAGFVWEPIPGYGNTDFPPGWHGFVGSK